MTILEFCKAQNRGLLPREVHAAFPAKTAQQISDSLADYVKRGKMRKILIPSAGRRYRYIALDVPAIKRRGKPQLSDVKPEALPLVRI